jgi:two-component system, sensor histidine kinase and response regulator
MKENKRILIIDDDEGIREVYSNILIPAQQLNVLSKGKALFESKNDQPEQTVQKVYEVTLAENGNHGIEEVKTSIENNIPFAVAFIDMKMPGINGAKTAKLIWEIDPDIKIVIVTAYSECSPEDIIKETGRDDIFYLRKPFNQEEIYQFARALTNEWNLERKRDLLEKDLKKANKKLEDINQNLKGKVHSLSRSEEHAKFANKAKSEFLANMSHEIRTPLNAILGFADILFNKEEDSNKKEQLKIILTSSVNLKNLINNILDFSKIEAGKIEVNNSVIPVKNIIDQTVSMFFLSAKKKNIKIDISIDKKIPEFIIADEQKIKQILTNLIGNALKFTQLGSITISSALKDEYISIKVTDTGIGIDQNKLENIFSAFDQADSSTTRKFGGTGLGLAISRSLALLLGGDITVSSRRGKGSVFEFSFKYKKAGKGVPQTYNLQTEHKTMENQTFEGFSILVAEDDINNQKLIETILSDLKTDFTIAQNGAIAIKRLKEKSFDLMLLDMQMPVKDGLETIIEIRDDLKIKKLPVIAFTANATSESVKKIRTAGCTDFLSKPAVKQKIQNMLSKYLNPENSQDRQHESSQKKQNLKKPELSESQIKQLALLKQQLEKQFDLFDPVSLIKIADSFADKSSDAVIKKLTDQIKSCAEDFDDDGLITIVNNINTMF